MCFTPLGRIDVDPLFEILEILNIEDVYALEIAKFIYKQKMTCFMSLSQTILKHGVLHSIITIYAHELMREPHR